jgi:hypothetical protein
MINLKNEKTKKDLLVQISITFAITLTAAMITTLLWSLLIERTGAVVDWKTSFVLAIIIGVGVPLSRIKS